MSTPLDFEAMEKAAGVVFTDEQREHIQQAVDAYRALASGRVLAEDVRRCARRVHAATESLLELAAVSDESPDLEALRAVLLGARAGFLVPLGLLSDIKERTHREHDTLMRLRDGTKVLLDTFEGRDGRPDESVRRKMLLSAAIEAFEAAEGKSPGVVWKRGTSRGYAGPLFDFALELVAQADEVEALSGPSTVGKMVHALVQRRKSK